MSESFPHPACQQERTIAVIKTDVTEVKGAFKDMISEFRALTKDLRESLLDGRELKIEVSTLKRDVDQCFVDLRELSRKVDRCEENVWKEFEKIRENRIAPLETWQTKTDARFAAAKIIPALCVVIVSLLTIYNATKQTEISQHKVEPASEIHYSR